ncbi:DUF899 family protein [Paracoccus zhejiangensis]|uniref:DUF899 domain-containing protein n=1 Tax=Paracoccus zhejiangensis TaxID=1077935 RepID=A0A2H5F1X7_9RHOB|nr:DUF899 family protein [Paracoccus zhejiangensis]AUH65533.1 DUF899 domain-containing protein [Paracoccus zhejiangensis]
MTETLSPADELAALKPATWPNESAEYRKARTAQLDLLDEQRRHIQRVAARRRALPPGGEVPQDYRFEGADGSVTLSRMFGDHDTLIIYCMMYGPERKAGCPMCSAMLDAWDGEARHIQKRAALAVVAGSPIARILDYARDRGWTGLQFYSDPSGDFWADYNHDRDADDPAYVVFRRDPDGTLRHFYSAEGGTEIADPGQDPHNAPDMNPLWVLRDTTPEGRGAEWYPRLDD